MNTTSPLSAPRSRLLTPSAACTRPTAAAPTCTRRDGAYPRTTQTPRPSRTGPGPLRPGRNHSPATTGTASRCWAKAQCATAPPGRHSSTALIAKSLPRAYHCPSRHTSRRRAQVQSPYQRKNRGSCPPASPRASRVPSSSPTTTPPHLLQAHARSQERSWSCRIMTRTVQQRVVSRPHHCAL